MKHPNAILIERFYTAFQTGDYRTMQDCYHAEATFRDPVFRDLSANEAKAMWQMLVTSARDLTIGFRDMTADETQGSVHWEAWYTFSRTGRKVHNTIDAHFKFREGKIWRHEDDFDLWRWSRQALGASGWLLGWSPVVKNKVRSTARRSLEKFIAQNGPQVGSA
jgi:ketosteroid isomerase-like protein